MSMMNDGMDPMVGMADTSVTDTTDEDVTGLAQALDATIDAACGALDAGDVGSAQLLLTAADATSDALLEALGVPDADDATEQGALDG